MQRDERSSHLVALLATGEEIRNGDILNTNAQEIAARLFNHGIQVGMHMVTGDKIAEIEAAIHFLLSNHRALIITGGLGPTSDDLTRYALSNALNKELILNEALCNDIFNRLKSLGYEKPPETNRQQALFPESATIIENPNGTAAGCYIEENNQIIFMLPGPPIECLPMVDEIVLPILKKNDFQKILFHQKWLLFGVSEGQIAEELDAIAQPYQCMTGYRLWYPYIEFKIYSNHQDDFNELIPRIEAAIAPYIIYDGKYSASDYLKQLLTTSDLTLNIRDEATGGLLETTLKAPETIHAFQSAGDLQIEVKGLNEFWHKISSTKTEIEINFAYKGKTKQIKKEIPLRGMRVKIFAVEYVCRKVGQLLSS